MLFNGSHWEIDLFSKSLPEILLRVSVRFCEEMNRPRLVKFHCYQNVVDLWGSNAMRAGLLLNASLSEMSPLGNIPASNSVRHFSFQK